MQNGDLWFTNVLYFVDVLTAWATATYHYILLIK